MRRAFVMALVLVRLTAFAQQLDLRAEGDAGSVLVRGFESTDATQPSIQATWRFAEKAPCAFTYQRLSSATGGLALTLRQLLLAGIGQYLDDRVHFGRTGVKCDLSDERLMADMNDMARSITAHFGAAEGFGGFTEPTMEQLERVTHIDWSKATFGIDAGNDQDKYLAIYYYVRSQRQELERQLRADLLPVAAVELLTDRSQDVASRGRSVQAPTLCTTVYDDGNFLCALDLAVADTAIGLADGKLDDRMMERLARQARERITEPPASAEGTGAIKLRKRDRWLKAELDRINDRIDQLDQRKELWALRDRMDDMEARIEDVGLEVQELKAGAMPQPSDNPIANLSDLTGRNVAIRFARSSCELDANGKAILNEVFEQLARSPHDRVLITGYTDKSGDPAVNMRLSEQRARVVRDHLAQRGIAADRLLVNYYGDSRSDARDPDQRRVELEWLR